MLLKISDTKYDFFLLSKFRGPLFGFAILCIMVFHSSMLGSTSWSFLFDLKKNCDFGVDIFLFLSGIGLYFSYNGNEDVILFYKKRFKRILLAYIPIACAWYALKSFNWPHDLNSFVTNSIMFIEDISLISFWTKGNLTGWFIALILVLYIVYPLIYKAINNYAITVTIAILIVLFCLICGLIYLTIYHETPAKYYWIEIALPRIPIFIFGCWIAPKVKDHKKIGAIFVCLCALICVICFFLLIRKPLILMPLVFRRFLYGPLASCTCVVLSSIFCQLKNKYSLIPLEWLGVYTLEIYLFHEKILCLLRVILKNNILLNIIAFCITLMCVPIYKRIYSKMLSCFFWCCDKFQFRWLLRKNSG